MTRAVSLVPSATDVAVALGATDRLVGISADCDQPDPSRPLPVVTRALVDGISAAHDPGGVDATVRELLAKGAQLYSLDVDLVVELAPDVVFAQDDCSVCAVPSSRVVAALAAQGHGCEVASLDPSDLEDVLRSFAEVGRRLGVAAAGAALEASCRQRLGALAGSGGTRRVAVLDWTDPPFLAGNWVPDLVRAAGGEPVPHSADATRSRPISMVELAEAAPDVVVVAPCGLDLSSSLEAGRDLRERALRHRGLAGTRFLAFDGRQWFSKPGPGLVDGAEALAAWLSTGAPPADGPARARTEAIDD